MDSLRLRNLVGYLVILVLPAVTFAATQPGSGGVPSTRESNLSKEAGGLLNQMHMDAYRVENSADHLASYFSEPELIAWETDSGVLYRLSYRDDDMDRILSRLRSMQRMLPPDQQEEIKKIAPAVVEITDCTQAAIQFLNLHQLNLFLPQNEGYARDIYNEASRVVAATANAGQ